MSDTDNNAPVAADNNNDVTQAETQKELLGYVERIEAGEEEKKAAADFVKEIYGEAKGRGFDVAVMKQLVARRKRDRDEIEESDSLLEIYEQALADAA